MRFRRRFWSALLNLFASACAIGYLSSLPLAAAPPDTTPPVISNLSFTSGPTLLGLVTYNEAMDSASATNVGNYLFGPGVSVTQAVLGPVIENTNTLTSSQTVTLGISGIPPNSTYSVTISGVKDLAGNSIVSTNLNGTVPFYEINWAMAGAATQSSTVDTGGGEAFRAIDGNTDGFFDDGSVTINAQAEDPGWWEVDLGATKPIGRVNIWFRTLTADECQALFNSCGVRNDDFTIQILDQSRNVLWKRTYPGRPPTSVPYNQATPLNGQFVRFESQTPLTTSDGFFSLAEVQVIAPYVGASVTVTKSPVSTTVTENQKAILGPVEAAITGAPAANAQYQWQKNGLPIPGANATTLSLLNVQDADAGTYTVVVTNSATSVTSSGAILTVTDIVPTITTPPASQSANTGDTVTFSVVAAGTPPFSYQWRKDGNGLPGATSSTLTLTNVQLADAGSYVVEVSNNAGVATSDPATLTVTVAPVFSLRERFADGDRTTQNLPASAAWFTSSGSNNLTAVAGQATQVVSSSRTLLAYFTNSAGAPVSVGLNQTLTLDFVGQFSGFDTGATAGSLTFAAALLRSVANPAAVAGTGFVPDGPPNTNGRVSGDFGSNNPTSNVFTNYGGYAAFTYTGLAGVATPIKLNARTGTNASLLNSNSPYVQVTGAAATPSVAMTASTDYHGTLTLQNTGSGIAITYTLRNAADNSVVMTYSAVQAAASFTQFDTAAFYVSKASTSANYNFVIKSVDVSLSGAVAGDPPAITTQPVSQTIPLGGTATFTVAATGTGTLTYQWVKNGAAITGANAATLSLTSVQATDAGGYRVVVSNAAGSTPSTDAILTVDSGPAPPSITFQPASQTVAIGGNASFTCWPRAARRSAINGLMMVLPSLAQPAPRSTSPMLSPQMLGSTA
jgi:hypothetical protein